MALVIALSFTACIAMTVPTFQTLLKTMHNPLFLLDLFTLNIFK
jgi:hypothetical protein